MVNETLLFHNDLQSMAQDLPREDLHILLAYCRAWWLASNKRSECLDLYSCLEEDVAVSLWIIWVPLPLP